MNKLIDAFVDFLKVKTIITVATVFTACYLVICGKMDVSVFVGIVVSVITYYFGKTPDMKK